MPRETNSDGPELLAIVLSAGYCTESQLSEFRTSVEKMKLHLKAQAKARGQNFSVVGVAVDWATEDGLRHLSRLGKFDQIIVGGGWSNVASSRALEFGPKNHTTAPQVLVLERVVRSGKGRVEIGRERLVHHVVGADEIARWVENGSPLRR